MDSFRGEKRGERKSGEGKRIKKRGIFEGEKNEWGGEAENKRRKNRWRQKGRQR